MGALPPIQGCNAVEAIFGDRTLPGSANAGLVFDRYLRIWAGGTSRPDKSMDIRGDLERFVRENNERVGKNDGHNAWLAEQHRRLGVLVAHGSGRTYRTTSRLVTGLGQDHPLENGFIFDRVAGVPVLPGSTIKGLLRAYLEMAGDTDRSDRFLGRAHDRNTPDDSQQGCLVVLPALPARWPRLAVDVVNCHHPDYYAGRVKDPVDWENPNPVYFLAVEADVEFVFRLALAPRSRSNEAAGAKLIEDAFGTLGAALATLGIGAKTAVGYGVMSPA